MPEEEFDYEVGEWDETPGDAEVDRAPRSGSFWVRKHNHEVLAQGNEPCPEPENAGVVLRRYFDNLDDAIVAWGRWTTPVGQVNSRLVREVVAEVAAAEGTKPLEYFFVESSRQYVAVVMRNSRGAGRLWFNSKEIHLITGIPRSRPFKNKGKTFYRVFLDSGPKVNENEVCPVLFQIVPTSGVCPCESPLCPYSGIN